MRYFDTSPSIFSFLLPITGILTKKAKGKEGNGKEGIQGDIMINDGVQRDTKFNESITRLETLEGVVNDLKTQLKNFEGGVKSTKAEMEGMKEELAKLNDTIKQLLTVYEVVSKEYNPFIDKPVKRRSALIGVDARQSSNEMLPSGISGIGGDSDVVSVKEHIIKTEDESLDKIIKPDQEVEDFLSDKLPDKQEDKGSFADIDNDYGYGSVITVNDKVENEPTRTFLCQFHEAHYLMQMIKLVEFQLEKIYVAKVSGLRPDLEDVQLLDRYLADFKRVGLR